MSHTNRKAPRKTTGSRLLATGLVLAALLAADRTVFFLRESSGSLCARSPDTEPVAETTLASFNVANPCFATDIELRKGEVYRIEVGKNVWHDGRLKADADGLWHVPPKLVVAGPSRRHVFRPWMELMGRVGPAKIEAFAIGSGLPVYQVKTTGELFLYVNDAVIGLAPGRNWALPYYWFGGPNEGVAHVTVSRVHGVD